MLKTPTLFVLELINHIVIVTYKDSSRHSSINTPTTFHSFLLSFPYALALLSLPYIFTLLLLCPLQLFSLPKISEWLALKPSFHKTHLWKPKDLSWEPKFAWEFWQLWLHWLQHAWWWLAGNRQWLLAWPLRLDIATLQLSSKINFLLEKKIKT